MVRALWGRADMRQAFTVGPQNHTLVRLGKSLNYVIIASMNNIQQSINRNLI
jgi:hypothetical protein